MSHATPTARYVTIKTHDGKYAKAMIMGGGTRWMVNEQDRVWVIPASDVASWEPLDTDE